MGARRRPGPGLHFGEPGSRAGPAGRPPPQAGGGHTARGPAAGDTSRQPTRPRDPQHGPRNHLKAQRVFSRQHVASGEPAAPTRPGKPCSGRQPVGLLNRSARLRPLLIGREPGSLRVGAWERKGRGLLEGCGLCPRLAQTAGNFRAVGGGRGLLSPISAPNFVQSILLPGSGCGLL